MKISTGLQKTATFINKFCFATLGLKEKPLKGPLTILLLALLAGGILASCGSATTGDKVEFIVANGSEPEGIDPHLISGTVENRIYQALFDSLYLYDPKDSSPINGLAESHTVSEDGTVYTFTLREGLKWNDGEPITSEDAVFSLRRILDPKIASPYAWFPALFIENGEAYNKGEASADELGIRAIDERTFEMTLVGPLPYVLDALTHYSFAILPKHTIEKHGDKWTLPENFVSNGPFVLKEWLPQDRLVVEKNPNYWDADSVALDRVVFLPSDDMNTNYNGYLNGEIDLMYSIPQGRIDEIKLRDDYYVFPQNATYYYSLQYNQPELQDVRVREALARSIDKQRLVDNVTKGGQIPTDAFVPPLGDYKPVEGLAYDVARAKELMAEAGYPDGEGFPTLTIIYNTNDGHKRVAEYIQQEWADNLGIDVSLENMEWKTFLKQRRAGDFQVARNGWVGDYLDPNTYLELYTSNSGSNEVLYKNPEYDALLAQASRSSNPAERLSIMRQAEALLIEKDAVLIPIYYYTASNMFNNKKWEGFYGNIADSHGLKFIKPLVQ